MIDIFGKGYDAITNTDDRDSDAISEWNDAILDTIRVLSEEATFGTLEAVNVVPYENSVIITVRAADMNSDLMWVEKLPDKLTARTFFYKRDEAYIIEVTLIEEC